MEPTIEPVSEETAAEERRREPQLAEARVAPATRVTRRSARNLLDETATRSEDAIVDEKEDGAARAGQGSEWSGSGSRSRSRSRRRPAGSPAARGPASLASTADADKTMEADEEEERRLTWRLRRFPPRRSTRRRARTLPTSRWTRRRRRCRQSPPEGGSPGGRRGVRRRGPGRDGARRRGLMRVVHFLNRRTKVSRWMIFSSQRNLETVCGPEGTPEDL